MVSRHVLRDYVGQAMAQAVFDTLRDGTLPGRIPHCQGGVALGGSLRDGENGLEPTLEDGILPGLRLGHPLSVLGDIDLNKEAAREAMTPSKGGRILRNKQHI
jgi:uncharacterized protein UPF0150